MLDVRRLRTFLAAADEGRFTGAPAPLAELRRSASVGRISGARRGRSD